VIIAAMDDEIDKEYVKEIERKIEEINSRVKKTSTVEYTISDKLRMSAFDVFEDLYSMNEFLIFGWGLIDEIDEKTERLLLKLYDENEDEIYKLLNLSEETRIKAKKRKDLRLFIAQQAVKIAAYQIVNNADSLM
jgi:hypothetical protein